MDQIVSQFLLKSLHIILDARVPSLRPNDCKYDSRSGSRVRKSERWFNLVLGERPAVLENLNFWHRSLLDPMFIDIILVHEGPSSSCSSSVDNLYATSGAKNSSETVLERWIISYESPRVAQTNDSSNNKKVYKKLIILLRALYLQMRLLPAYKIFQKLRSSGQIYNFNVIYKVSTFGEPFSQAEQEMMDEYSFTPIEASPGRLAVSVTYRKTVSDFNLEPAASLFPKIITDYVGSPTTDPLRSFPTSDKGVRATSFPLRGVGSPSSSPLQRPHSWTSGFHRGPTFTQNNLVSGSPPIYGTYGSPSPPTDITGYRVQNYRIPTQKDSGSDDYQLSPPFSSSPSPSPPVYSPGGPLTQSRGRSGTAPMTIPYPRPTTNNRYISPNLSDPNRHSLPPPSPRSSRLDPSSQESPSGIRSFRKSESLRIGDLPHVLLNNSFGQRAIRDSRDDSGRFSGLLSSSGSPRIGFSRSSSRLSFQDDTDDIDFSCPFDVDDVESSDSPASHKHDGKRTSEFTSTSVGAKSQDAALGFLVHMLRTAAPLRQDSSCYSSHTQKPEQEGVSTASGFHTPRKTSDALEELRSYREVKDLLLPKSGRIINKEA